MGDICGDNRFEVIAKAKNHLLQSTNIDSSEDEMKVLDSFLFRCWQMDWLKQYDKTATNWIKVDDALPEVGEMVLIRFWNTQMHMGFLQSNGTWHANFNDYKVDLATHWLSIELPKEDNL